MENNFSSKLPGGSAMPPEKQLSVRRQKLTQTQKVTIQQKKRSSFFRPLFVFFVLVITSSYAVYEMYHVFLTGSLTILEWVVLFFFTLSFSWIALAFSHSFVGLFTQAKKGSKTQKEIELKERIAVVMPVYNESTEQIFAIVETMALDLAATPQGAAFDWFILSDSTNPACILAEEKAFWLLRQACEGKANVYYRRRLKNVGHKSGNIEDFCHRWGYAFEAFIVLDADSVMETQTLITLAERMHRDPTVGLIQTIPVLINGRTPFARVQQFASRMYGPLLGSGLAWWTQNEGNFWGHNAILRTKAYIESAGLPVLPGSPPFGGPILSHDFVEGALIRRAGWKVVIASDLGGSYEESPPSIYDMAIRDRRWCQGNLQHAKIVNARGLHWISRFHMLTGMFSYFSSPLWFLLIVSGLLLALQSHFLRPEYFTNQFTLFPVWPEIDYIRALCLFIFTMVILFAPKLFGLFKVLFSNERSKQWGGRCRIFTGFFLEVILSALIAPIMMLLQTGSVTSVLLFRKDCRWQAQRRDDGTLSIKELWRFHRWHLAWGLLLGYGSFLYSWILLAWMSPAIIGLWLSIPLSALTASRNAGRWLKKLHILATPEEMNTPDIVQSIEKKAKDYSSHLETIWDINMLLEHRELMALHQEIIDKLPVHSSGACIDPLRAVTTVKVHEARYQSDLLQVLTTEELSHLLGNTNLLKNVLRLPKKAKVAKDIVAS